MGQFSARDCDAMRGYVSASLDGELSELDQTRLDAHLVSCAGCRTYAAGAAEATRLMRATSLEELDFPIVLPTRRLAAARRLQVAASAAAIALTVALGVVVGSVSSTSGSGGPPANNRASTASSLRFPEQELRMLHRASETRARLVIHSRLAL
jgi:anti-sigma factor RsiW